MVSRNAKVLSVLTLALINVAAVANLSQLAILAEYGLAAVFFLGAAALVFFVPCALVSAELATGWPKAGGVYAWVKEAFGPRLGFVAIWLQWVENIFWYPTVLSFAAATFAFIIDPTLASNTMYTFVMILIITWAVTLINFKGMKTSSWISSFGVLVGTIFPAILVILMGTAWVLMGGQTQIPLTTASMMPDLSSIANIVFFVGVILSFAGIEMSAVHAREVKDPQKDYPKAIFLSVFIIFAIALLGSLSIAIVVPQSKILLTAGIMEAFEAFFTYYGIAWTMPILAILIAAGSIGMVNTWIVGPSKGLLATAEDGNLPPFFQKANQNGMPTNLLMTQAFIITVLSMVFIFMPSVNSSYWILAAMTVQLYLIMYILMFAAAIKLKYSQPNTPRAYKVPFGKAGMWGIAGIGIIASFFSIGIGFIPPSQFGTGDPLFYVGFLATCMFIACVLPFIIMHFKKASWKPSTKKTAKKTAKKKKPKRKAKKKKRR